MRRDAQTIDLFGSSAPGRDRPPPSQVLTPRPEAALLPLVNGAGAAFRKVVLTRNRRVMLSSGKCGTALRMHHAFAAAPEPVLAAVGRLYSRAGPAERTAARALIRRFLAGIPQTEGARRRRPRRHRPGDTAFIECLNQEFQRVNAEHFSGTLPAVPIFLSGAMRRRLGHFCADPLEIVISRELCVRGAPGEAEGTLRHEMIHLWQHSTGRRPDHGADFRRWARALGVPPRASREVCWKGV